LAEQGAEVIRIEKREGSEDRFQAPVSKTGDGALFLQMNRNKLGLTLDPMRPEGQQIVRQLVATADVVVANLPPQTLLDMKLDYASLTSVKPDIILTTVTAYGRGGPYSDRVGFDGIGQAMSGAVYMTGEEDQPYRAQVPWVDFGTALHCAFGTMAAIMARKVTGKGQIVEGALLATAVTFGNALLIEQAVAKPDRVPTKNRSQTAGPVDLFRAKDGWILGRKMLTLHDSGAYARFSPYGVTKHSFHHTGAYTIPNLHFDGYVVFTNRVPTTAMRGFGVTSVSFATEMHVSRIADVLGVDPFEIRLKNANRIGDTSPNGIAYTDPSTVPTIHSIAEAIGHELPGDYRAMTRDARGGDLLPEHLVAQVGEVDH